jgi:S-adenosylmethionine:tRNA ribosyltransferase-isomerase
MIDLDEWDFDLPDDRIARHPVADRDAARLLVVPRGGGAYADRFVRDLPELLSPGDLLVGNDTRVMQARLSARRRHTGGAVEVLLLAPGPGPVEALLRPGRRIREGEVLALDGGGTVRVVERRAERFLVELDADPAAVMAAQGEVPLPPYLGRDAVPEDRERYQTTYAGPLGASAAPTAGLHFTPRLFEALGRAPRASNRRGVGSATVTLHVGLGTFRPPRPEDLAAGRLHEEPFTIPSATVDAITATRARGGRVVAIGTTTVRALETATPEGARIPRSGPGQTDLLIAPGYRFKAIDGLVTNFHLPRSSLLLLVGALVGRGRLLEAYAHALRSGYRYFSYGDAMLVL